MPFGFGPEPETPHPLERIARQLALSLLMQGIAKSPDEAVRHAWEAMGCSPSEEHTICQVILRLQDEGLRMQERTMKALRDMTTPPRGASSNGTT